LNLYCGMFQFQCSFEFSLLRVLHNICRFSSTLRFTTVTSRHLCKMLSTCASNLPQLTQGGLYIRFVHQSLVFSNITVFESVLNVTEYCLVWGIDYV
jgi:hypothetical protein